MFTRRKLLLTGAAASTISSPALFAATATSLSVGLSLPLTGTQAEVAADLKLGYELALKNTPLSLLVLDDQSKPDICAANVRELAGNPSVIAISGLVGTPHAQAALPEAIKAGVPVVGIRSGAQVLRKSQEGVFHLRSSYEDELTRVASLCKGAGTSKMILLYSEDSFGTGARDHLTEQLKGLGIGIAGSIPVERNGGNMEDATAKVAQLANTVHEPMAIALLLISKPMIAAAQLLRVKHRIVTPMFSMSFVSTRSFSLDKSPALRGLGMVSAFPLPRIDLAPLVAQYRAKAIESGQPILLESITALEGYFYGRVIVGAAVQARSRTDLMKSLNQGVPLAEQPIKFDATRVGYRYLAVLSKDADGRLRA